MARIAVVAPGRGSYNRSELGYLNRFAQHASFSVRGRLLADADRYRHDLGQATLSSLDQASSYQPGLHLPGENASALIYTCSAADFLMLEPRHQVVCVLGNSMGWYTTLFLGGCLDFLQALEVVNSMGGLQAGNVQGGQIIFPVVDGAWRLDVRLQVRVEETLAEVCSLGEDHWVGLSIRLGGFLVLAGREAGVKELLRRLPKLTLGSTDYPFQLPKHAAFHTPIMQKASEFGLARFAQLPIRQPLRAMIDGRGHLWRPLQTEGQDLLNYTFGHQVVQPYDFTQAVRVALREFNPDHLVLLGPGESLGGSIAQVMIAESWRGLDSKQAFAEAQLSAAPPLLAMSRPEQAVLLLG